MALGILFESAGAIGFIIVSISYSVMRLKRILE